MFQRGSKFYSKISSGGSIFFEKLVPGGGGGTNFGGSIFAVTGPWEALPTLSGRKHLGI